jgi:hypothetical protein
MYRYVITIKINNVKEGGKIRTENSTAIADG